MHLIPKQQLRSCCTLEMTCHLVKSEILTPKVPSCIVNGCFLELPSFEQSFKATGDSYVNDDLSEPQIKIDPHWSLIAVQIGSPLRVALHGVDGSQFGLVDERVDKHGSNLERHSRIKCRRVNCETFISRTYDLGMPFAACRI